MRARYYNTDIERFISQDILTGNPENSQSLNRYAYCQGNPVNQNDPFGLCPMGLTTRQWIHLGLDLLGCIPVIGIAANAVNAVLYFQEGDILSGLLSVAGAVIGIGGLSSAIGAAKGICTLAKVGSVLKTAGTAVTTAGMAAMTIEGAVNTYNVLKENDFKITGESLLSAGTTLLSAAATVAGFKALGSSVRETTALIRSGAACFTAGTLVLTENGQKAIEDIQAGDKVYATDPETGESGYKEVLQTFEKETEVVVHVTYEKDGEGSNTETTTVNTTLNHRFWTEDGWKSAGTLEAGDKLTLADGNTATVTNVAYEDTHATVYNFEVEDFHTYYVGTESVLVHNNGGNCMKTASALAQGGSKGGVRSNNKVYFGQQAVSPNFSQQGTFKGASIQSVSDSLSTGKLSPDSLPIEYIVRDGKMITMNNRSLTALSKANMKPTVLIDITGDAVNEAKLTQRLSEMGGQPSENIIIRKLGEIVHIPN